MNANQTSGSFGGEASQNNYEVSNQSLTSVMPDIYALLETTQSDLLEIVDSNLWDISNRYWDVINPNEKSDIDYMSESLEAERDWLEITQVLSGLVSANSPFDVRVDKWVNWINFSPDSENFGKETLVLPEKLKWADVLKFYFQTIESFDRLEIAVPYIDSLMIELRGLITSLKIEARDYDEEKIALEKILKDNPSEYDEWLRIIREKLAESYLAYQRLWEYLELYNGLAEILKNSYNVESFVDFRHTDNNFFEGIESKKSDNNLYESEDKYELLWENSITYPNLDQSFSLANHTENAFYKRLLVIASMAHNDSYVVNNAKTLSADIEVLKSSEYDVFLKYNLLQFPEKWGDVLSIVNEKLGDNPSDVDKLKSVVSTVSDLPSLTSFETWVTWNSFLDLLWKFWENVLDPRFDIALNKIKRSEFDFWVNDWENILLNREQIKKYFSDLKDKKDGPFLNLNSFEYSLLFSSIDLVFNEEIKKELLIKSRLIKTYCWESQIWLKKWKLLLASWEEVNLHKIDLDISRLIDKSRDINPSDFEIVSISAWDETYSFPEWIDLLDSWEIDFENRLLSRSEHLNTPFLSRNSSWYEDFDIPRGKSIDEYVRNTSVDPESELWRFFTLNKIPFEGNDLVQLLEDSRKWNNNWVFSSLPNGIDYVDISNMIIYEITDRLNKAVFSLPRNVSSEKIDNRESFDSFNRISSINHWLENQEMLCASKVKMISSHLNLYWIRNWEVTSSKHTVNVIMLDWWESDIILSDATYWIKPKKYEQYISYEKDNGFLTFNYDSIKGQQVVIESAGSSIINNATLSYVYDKELDDKDLRLGLMTPSAVVNKVESLIDSSEHINLTSFLNATKMLKQNEGLFINEYHDIGVQTWSKVIAIFYFMLDSLNKWNEDLSPWTISFINAFNMNAKWVLWEHILSNEVAFKDFNSRYMDIKGVQDWYFLYFKYYISKVKDAGDKEAILARSDMPKVIKNALQNWKLAPPRSAERRLYEYFVSKWYDVEDVVKNLTIASYDKSQNNNA